MSMAAKNTHEASSSSHRWKYDVFLSFCGNDTRTNFTDHLYGGLDQAGILTFRDDEKLEKGEDITSELMDAIEGSRIAIIVFSENYASSTWCLNELVKILDCKKSGQIERVLPIFYKVDPSDVRKQSNTYSEAFVRHKECFKEEMEKVWRWKNALTEAANLSGWNQSHVADGHELELIKKIVGEVLTTVNQTHLDVAAYPIGLDTHIDRICSLLNDGLDAVRFIGVHGLGGIGKTTIAKAIFNVMFKNFEGSSFLANVREVSRQQNGIALLQTQLLSDVLKIGNINISNEDRGIINIKEKLCHKRVLIIVDDVNKMRQLDKLVGKRDWFGPGSRIIITSRDEHLVHRPEVDERYKVETMNPIESLQLFSFHAFRQNHPLEGYVELSNDVVHYAGGLPLALVILGSLLMDKRSQVEWTSELEKLRKIPNGEILEILEISYEALDDFNSTIFLDISCFFIGWDTYEVILILDACGLCPKSGIKLLLERSLVTVDEQNKLSMHDLVRDMGREIVRRQSPQKPGERSRLWLDEDGHRDALDVLINFTGTDAVQGLELDWSKCLNTCMKEEKFQMTTNAFLKMPNLRLLRISDSTTIDWEHSLDDRIFIFRNVVWICWEGFPFEYIPNNFHLGNLVILDMQHSQLKEIWKGNKFLPKLKVLNLNDSDYLTCTPEFTGLPNLETLILKNCCSLVKVHESIDHLSKLVHFDLQSCVKLRNLPDGITKLASLEELDISLCSKLEKLPQGIGNLTCLTSLLMVGTAIEEIPPLGLLKNLAKFSYNAPCRAQYSSLRARERNLNSVASLFSLYSLEYLYLGYCKLADDDIPDDIGKLCRLKSLDLSGNDFISLPSSICQLSRLEILTLRHCELLQSLPMLPSSLHSLNAECCRSLERLPNLSNLKHLRRLKLSLCSTLNEIEGLEGLESVEYIDLQSCNSLESFVKERIFQEITRDFQNRNICDIFLTESEIPDWFYLQSSVEEHQIPEWAGLENESPSAYCQVTQLHNMEIQGLIICVVCQAIERPHGHTYLEVVLHSQSKHFTWNHGRSVLINDQYQIWLIKMPHCVWKSIAEFEDSINVSVKQPLAELIAMIKIAAYLFYPSHA